MLTDAVIKKKKPEAKPKKHWDEHGLYLLINPNNVRGWRWKYYWRGKERLLSLGPYPLITLEKAREKRDDLRRLLRDGVDPAKSRLRAKAAKKGESFREVAMRWLASRHKNSADTTTEKIQQILERHVFPAIGDDPIGALEPIDILEMLRVIEATGKHETTHRAHSVTGRVFRFAIAEQLATRDMAADVREALAPVKVEHHAAVTTPAAVARVLRLIDTLPFTTVGIAMRLAPYLWVRPGELRFMEPKELDLDAALWTIPASKTKLRRDHLVPLAPQAVALLRQRPMTGRYVFPSPRTAQRPISDATLTATLRALGVSGEEHTVHGFRSTARTLLDEKLRYPPDVIEVQLAHKIPGSLGATYNRAQHLEQRIAMMKTYADYLDRLKKEAG